MRLWRRYSHLTLWNKIAFLGALASVLGLLLGLTTLWITGRSQQEPLGSLAFQFSVTLDPQYQHLLQDPIGRKIPSQIDQLDAATRRIALSYTYQQIGDRLTISPQMRYLSALSASGPVVGQTEPFKWGFPTLSIKAVNNTKDTVYLTEIVLEVLSSKVNKQPVIVFEDGTWNSLVICNEGWGKVLAPKIQFGFTESERFAALDPRAGDKKYSASLESFEESTSLPLESYFPRRKLTLTAGKESRTIELPAWGNYCMYGVMSYTSEEEKNHRVYFKCHVNIGLPPLEAVFATTAIYAVELRTGESGYMKRIPIAHYLKAGDVEHFLLAIASDKSGSFNLNLSLLSAGNKDLGRKYIFMDVFVPRTQRDKYEVRDLTNLSANDVKP